MAMVQRWTQSMALWWADFRQAPLAHLEQALLHGRAGVWLPWILGFLCLLALRLQLTQEMGEGFLGAVHQGFFWGAFADFWALLLAAGMVQLLHLMRLPMAYGIALGLLAVGGSSLANLLYFSFFQSPLEWWTVRMHLSDVGQIQGSALNLSFSPTTLVAIFFLMGACLSAFKKTNRLAVGGGSKFLALVLTVTALLVGNRIPAWATNDYESVTVLGNHVLRSWYNQSRRGARFGGAGDAWQSALATRLDQPAAVLSRFRDGAYGDEDTKNSPPGSSSEPLDYPLLKERIFSAEKSRPLRRHLGLPEEGPLHVVILFLESFRAYEFQHPKLKEELFPKLWQILDQQAVFVPQAYSSSFSAGQTARGKWSTLCSMLPNTLGPATYIAHHRVRATCLPGVLREAGYQTYWINSHNKEFHGQYAFGLEHGTDHFLDHDYFKAAGITQTLGDWGLADAPVLQKAASVLIERATQENAKPVFAEVLTIATHHPFRVLEDQVLGPLATKLAQKGKSYHGYLTRLAYTDQAASDFIRTIYDSPMGERTLMVLLGDHSNGVLPEQGLGPEQKSEIRFRIPMAFLGPKRSGPTPDYAKLAHQADVAPTIAAILGLGEGRALSLTWLGKSLFDGEHTPWLYDRGTGVSYRMGSTACYQNGGERQCWQVEEDFLYEPPKVGAEEDEALSAFFEKVLLANTHAIAKNAIAP